MKNQKILTILLSLLMPLTLITSPIQAKESISENLSIQNKEESSELNSKNKNSIEKKEVLKENLKNGYTVEEAFTFIKETGEIVKYDPSIGGINVKIPPTIEGIPVTSISGQYVTGPYGNIIFNGAFENLSLRSIEIPNCISEIREEAFQYNNLTNLILPDSITIIGNSAFANNQLKNLKISNSITKIENSTFANNQLTDIEIPNSVTSIGDWTFANNQLTNLILPNSITIIGNSAFANNQLKNLKISNGITKIENSTFANNKLTNVEIPNGVTSIGNSAFANNQLTSVKLPDSITSLNGFTNNRLTYINIPDSVTSIGNKAFDTNQLTSVEIPDSVISIGDYAFSLNELKSLKLGNNIETIGDSSFENNKLTSVEIPNSVTYIGDRTFRTNKLSNLILPENVIRVGSHIIDDNKINNIYYENINGKYIVDLKKINSNIKTNNVNNVKVNSISSITNGNYDSNTGIIMLDKKPISGTTITYTYNVSNKYCVSTNSTITILLENELDNSESELKDKAISNISYYDLDDIILEGNIESDKTFDKNIKKSILVKSKDGQVKLEKNIENTDKYGNGYSGFKAILSKDDFDKIGNLTDGTIEIKIEYNGEVITLPYNINPANKNSRMSTGYFDWESTHYKIENFPSIELGKNTVSIKVDSNNRVLLNNKVNDYGINLLAYYLNDDRYVFDLGIECGNFDISTKEHKNIFEVKDSSGNVVYTGNAVTFKEGAFPNLNLKPKTAVQIIVPVEYSTNDYNIELIVEDKNGVEQYRFNNLPKWK